MSNLSNDRIDDPAERAPLSALRSAHIRNRPTMSADAVAAIRDAIIFGEIPPGAPLRLEHVAESLGMSVSPVREALRQLENLGLAESVPYRGSRVTRLDLEEIGDICELRLAVETVSVRWAAERLTLDDEARLRETLERLELENRGGDIRAAVRGNTEFHSRLAAASRSPWAARVLRPLLDTAQRYSAAVQLSNHRSESIDIESVSHRAILEACAAHDPDAAAKALEAHLDAFRRECEIALAGPSGTEATAAAQSGV